MPISFGQAHYTATEDIFPKEWLAENNDNDNIQPPPPQQQQQQQQQQQPPQPEEKEEKKEEEIEKNDWDDWDFGEYKPDYNDGYYERAEYYIEYYNFTPKFNTIRYQPSKYAHNVKKIILSIGDGEYCGVIFLFKINVIDKKTNNFNSIVLFNNS